MKFFIQFLFLPFYSIAQIDISNAEAIFNSYRNKNCDCGSTSFKKTTKLKWNILLEKAASNHAFYLRDNNLFSHKGENKSNVSDRIKTTGYKIGYAAENIAKGYETIEDVFEAWIKSEGHCVNMMSGNYTEFGLVKLDDYWVMVLGSELKK